MRIRVGRAQPRRAEVHEVVAAPAQRGLDHGPLLSVDFRFPQHARQVLPITDRAAILERGRVAHEGPSAALLAAPETIERHLGGTVGCTHLRELLQPMATVAFGLLMK